MIRQSSEGIWGLGIAGIYKIASPGYGLAWILCINKLGLSSKVSIILY